LEDYKLKIFPNPISNGNDLNIDLSELKTEVKYIEVVEVGLRLVAYISSDEISQRMSLKLPAEINPGIYIVNVHLENGEVLREKIVLLAKE